MSSVSDDWVGTVLTATRPLHNLDEETRQLQKQSLINFRTLNFERVNANWEDKVKRGFLFEALVLSDPRFPQKTEVERQVANYLIGALEFDLFEQRELIALNHPDYIDIHSEDGVAVVVGLVEIKLDLTHPHVQQQLKTHTANLKMLEAVVNEYLASGSDLPEDSEKNLAWPASVRALVVPDDYDRVVFKDRGSHYVKIADWQVLPALFSRKEIRVLANLL